MKFSSRSSIRLTDSRLASGWSEETASDFGQVTELLTFNSSAGYSINDISGMYKSDYTSYYYSTSAAYYEDEERYDIAYTYLLDNGKDDDGEEWMIANGFSGFEDNFSKGDKLDVNWWNGYLYLSPQAIAGKYVAKGKAYDIYTYLYDGEYI